MICSTDVAKPTTYDGTLVLHPSLAARLLPSFFSLIVQKGSLGAWEWGHFFPHLTYLQVIKNWRYRHFWNWLTALSHGVSCFQVFWSFSLRPKPTPVQTAASFHAGYTGSGTRLALQTNQRWKWLRRTRLRIHTPESTPTHEEPTGYCSLQDNKVT